MLLRLRGIRAKDQERTCLEEIRKEEDIEERLAREGTDLSDLERIELRERWKWMAKEEKLKKRQAAKMARFTKELEEREATKEAYLARRTEERVIAREKTSGRTQDRREKLRFWRDPQTRRWLEDPLSVKTPLIDAFARVTSSLHCPRLRDGALLPSKPSKRGNVEENVSYKSTASLEKRLERSWTENVPEPIRKPSRQTLQIANDIDRVCVAIKEDSTQEVDADGKMRLATKPHEHGDGPSATFTMATVFTTTKVLTPMTSKAAPSPSSLKPASQPKNAFFARTVSNGCKVRQLRTWTPTNNKYFETLSYLPPLTNEQIGKQVDYMVRNGWTPCLEFASPELAYVESNANVRFGPVSSNYVDNRYWTMWKLPMFGCKDSTDVLAEIEKCQKTFPGYYIRLAAFDAVRQVQIAGFLVFRPKEVEDYVKDVGARSV